MKKNLLFLIGATVLTATMLVSCEKDDIDNEKPVIVINAPVNGTEIKPGDDIHFDIELSDNVGLLSYTVNIHNAFDGHSHGVAKASHEEDDSEPFEKTWDESEFIALGEQPIAGKRSVHLHHHHIVIPESIMVDGVNKPVAEGKYHLIVRCLDESKIESLAAVDIVISYDAEEHDHHHH